MIIDKQFRKTRKKNLIEQNNKKEDVLLKIAPKTLSRLYLTADILKVSSNDLVNSILDEVLI